jgi:hypothetical protein
MLHVFVETNWVVSYVGPAFEQDAEAKRLLGRAQAGELRIHLPKICLIEASRTLGTKFHRR